MVSQKLLDWCQRDKNKLRGNWRVVWR